MKHWAAVMGLALVACGTPPPVAVRVDVDRVLQTIPAETWEIPSDPTPPATTPAKTDVLPGFPRREVRDPSLADPAHIKALLAQEQAAAQKTLEGLLREFYRAQTRAFELDQTRLGSDQEGTLYAAANLAVRAAFEELATVRGPKLARLSMLAGFPDRNPDSTQPAVKLGAVSQARFDESKQLRDEIQALDDGFLADVRQRLRAVEEMSAIQRAQALVTIELFKAKLDKQAKDEADAQVRRATDSLDLRLANRPAIVLPAVPDRAITTPAMPVPAPALGVPSLNIGQSRDERRALVRHELTIWLALNRLRLAEQGPDKTEEFIRWRSEHQVKATASAKLPN